MADEDSEMDPEEVSEALDGEIPARLQNLQENTNHFEQDESEDDPEFKETDEEISQDEESVGKEKKEADQAVEDNSREEAEKAASDAEKIIEMLQTQEKMIKAEIEDVENELREANQLIHDFEDADKDLISVLNSSRLNLKEVMERFQENAEHPDKKILKENFNQLKQSLGNIYEVADITARFLEVQEGFLAGFQKFEKHQYKLENQTSEIAKEMEVEEQVVEELIQEMKRIRDQKGYKETEYEAEEVEELEEYFLQEENEEEMIDRKIKEEIKESEVLIHEEDGEIIKEMEAILEELDELEEFLINQQDRLSPILTARIYKTVFQELQKTENKLRDALQKDRTEYDRLSDRFKDVTGAAKQVWDQAAENSKYEFDLTSKTGAAKKTGGFLAKWGIRGLIGIVLFVLIVLGMLQVGFV